MREVWRSQTCTSGSPFFCFEPVFISRVNRFCGIKAWIQGAKRSKVGYLASICNAVAMFLGRKSCRVDDECRFTLWRSKESKCPVGTRRMVKAKRMLTTKPKPFSGRLNSTKGSLKTNIPSFQAAFNLSNAPQINCSPPCNFCRNVL